MRVCGIPRNRGTHLHVFLMWRNNTIFSLSFFLLYEECIFLFRVFRSSAPLGFMRICGFSDVPRVFRMFRAFSKLFVLYQAVIAAKIEFETHAFGANTIYTAGTSHGSAPGLYKVFGLKVGQQSGGRKPIFLGHAIEHTSDDTYLIAVDYAGNGPLPGICAPAVARLGCPGTEKHSAAVLA